MEIINKINLLKYCARFLILLIPFFAFASEKEIFSSKNLTAKRPGFGLNPMTLPSIFGRRSKRNYNIDDLIKK